ncbi:MAG TPA: hypothetical protein VKV15_01640 [Bryobacteraceae bacterium]|nr:hypothetical protein [Bryobacteraceae bacterium]
MSPSEEAVKLSGTVAAVVQQIAATTEGGELAAVTSDDVTSLLTGAIKLYVACVDEREMDIAPIDATVSTTEAMVVACALLRAQHLNPFDLAVWFQRTTPKAT